MARLPKPPHLRQRRNRVASMRTFAPEVRAEGTAVVPILPPLGPGRRWHIRASSWWRSVWESPMAGEYLEADKGGLYILARLQHDFWSVADINLRLQLAAEIRQQGARFGLSPVDRRRLQWEIERADQAGERTKERNQPRPDPTKDPRATLKVEK